MPADVLDLVEQALPLRALLIVSLILVEFPVAAENQEHQHLYSEYHGSSCQGRGEVLDTLVLFPLSGAGTHSRRRRRRRLSARHLVLYDVEVRAFVACVVSLLAGRSHGEEVVVTAAVGAGGRRLGES
jgi:hypothetical protein